MADPKKHIHINGGSFIAELKGVFYLLRTRSTVAFAYGFMLAFVVFTVFLAFNPSTTNSSTPWLTNIFSSSTTPSSSLSNDSSRSQFSSIYSYFFPNIHNSTSPPTSENTTFQLHRLNKDHSMSKNHFKDEAPYDEGEVFKGNQTQGKNLSGKDVDLKANQTLNLQSDSSSEGKRIYQKEQPIIAGKSVNSNLTTTSFKANQTVHLPSNSSSEGKRIHQKDEPVIADKSVNSNLTATSSKANQTVNSPSNSFSEGKRIHQKEEPIIADKSVHSNSMATSFKANQTVNLPSNSSSEGKRIHHKEDSNIADNHVNSNLTAASFPKKLSNVTSTGRSQKRREEELIENLLNCNLFDGNWVRDDSYPLYKPGSCSLIDEQFNCFLNGRPDRDYQKLKWKPNGCSLPRLNASHMLELLRGKRLVFVGDSLNRNMWESLVCILRNSVKDKRNVFEASGRHYFRTEASYSFIFKDYNFSVEFFVSPFLVLEWETPDINGLKKETLRLDVIGRLSDKYKTADIIVFNTGHWWTHEKTSKGKDYYQEGSHVYDELDVTEAFRRALTTWGRWVDANINRKRTTVFFRGYSASHFSGGQWNSGGQCDNETEPIKNEKYLSPYPRKMRVLETVLKGMKTPVSYLNITRMTDYRKDGHPSVYRKKKLSEEEKRSPLSYQDCSHWCLPGVPDAWNELLYAELLIKEYQNKKRPEVRN